MLLFILVDRRSDNTRGTGTVRHYRRRGTRTQLVEKPTYFVRFCRDAGFYGHTTTFMHSMRTPAPPTPSTPLPTETVLAATAGGA